MIKIYQKLKIINIYLLVTLVLKKKDFLFNREKKRIIKIFGYRISLDELENEILEVWT